MVKIGETTCFGIAVTWEDNHLNDKVLKQFLVYGFMMPLICA